MENTFYGDGMDIFWIYKMNIYDFCPELRHGNFPSMCFLSCIKNTWHRTVNFLENSVVFFIYFSAKHNILICQKHTDLSYKDKAYYELDSTTLFD